MDKPTVFRIRIFMLVYHVSIYLSVKFGKLWCSIGTRRIKGGAQVTMNIIISSFPGERRLQSVFVPLFLGSARAMYHANST